MATIRREAWISVITAAAPISLCGYRVLSMAAQNQLSAAALLGELLGALVFAILGSWTVQLVMSRNWLAAIAVAATTLAIAGFNYLPHGGAPLTGLLLIGSCQLLIFLYAATALKPQFAKALARKNRRVKK